MNALVDPEYGWQRHPVIKMWRGYELALYDYQYAICAEWESRGYHDTCRAKTYDLLPASLKLPAAIGKTSDTPPWLGDEQFHLSHQSNLIRKDPEFYRPLFPDTPDNLPYAWPVID